MTGFCIARMGEPLVTFEVNDDADTLYIITMEDGQKQVITADRLDAAALHSFLARKFNL